MPGRAYLFYPQTPCKISVFEAFHPNSTQNTTSISTSTKPWKIKHFITFHTIKNHLIPPKILSNPYKIRLQSNSTENRIYNKEITPLNKLIYKSKIPQNISKINTFTQHKIHKQHHSIEVIIFYHQIYIKLISKNPYQLISHHTITQLHQTTPSHSLPVIIRLNQRKSTQISIKITSMIKYLSK